MGLKYSIDFTVAFSKSLSFCSQKKCHDLLGISEKVHITAKFQKTEFDKCADCCLKYYIYLFDPNIMDQDSHNSC